MEYACIKAISFAFWKSSVYWEIECQIKYHDKQIIQGILTVYHTTSKICRIAVVCFLFTQTVEWRQVTQRWHQLNGNILQTVVAEALIQDAASAHASMNLLPITLSFFLAEDADFTKGAGALCFESSHTK